MKTTVEISDPLLQQAQALAAREGITFRVLVERGLHRVIQEMEHPAPFRLRRASVRGEGLQPEFQGAPWEKFLDAAYEGRGT